MSLLAVACAGRARPAAPPSLPPLRPAADSAATTEIAPGVRHHALRYAAGPQRVHVLEVDRAACWTLRAHKAGEGAAGRTGTLALARDLTARAGAEVVGGVNADFFLFAPAGLPVGAHVAGGRVVAGPVARPVLALDSAGAVHVAQLRSAGDVRLPGVALPLDGWNRGSAGGVALFDPAWGTRTDSAPGRRFARLRTLGDPRAATLVTLVTAVDTGSVAPIPADGAVLALGAQAGPAARAAFAALRPGADTVRVTRALAPVAPREAVGGLPVLVRDGAIDPGVDTVGAAGFRGPNPRTAVGVRDGGRRVLLVTVDGRRPGVAAGTTVRETAELLRALGARDAINLDGGGSTTMVVRGPDGALRIVNTPSDSAGERPVGNALLVARGGCAAR